jgi:hypothetical protein
MSSAIVQLGFGEQAIWKLSGEGGFPSCNTFEQEPGRKKTPAGYVSMYLSQI